MQALKSSSVFLSHRSRSTSATLRPPIRSPTPFESPTTLVFPPPTSKSESSSSNVPRSTRPLARAIFAHSRCCADRFIVGAAFIRLGATAATVCRIPILDTAVVGEVRGEILPRPPQRPQGNVPFPEQTRHLPSFRSAARTFAQFLELCPTSPQELHRCAYHSRRPRWQFRTLCPIFPQREHR